VAVRGTNECSENRNIPQSLRSTSAVSLHMNRPKLVGLLGTKNTLLLSAPLPHIIKSYKNITAICKIA
jgi:hypothetical protein